MRMRTLQGMAVAAMLAGLAVGAQAQGYGQGYGQGYPPPPPPGYGQGYGQGGWDAAPPEFREAQRQGFQDGITGARHDFDNHRFPNVNNRDEYRHPHVPGSLKGDYRDGFRRGYKVAMDHLLHQGGVR